MTFPIVELNIQEANNTDMILTLLLILLRLIIQLDHVCQL
jgi:hypothetical protein